MSEPTESGASRRDVLKATGAAAVGAATFFATAAAITENAGATVIPHVAAHVPTSMGVVIDGVAVTRVRSISRSRLTVTVERSVSSSGTVSFGRGISNAPVVSLTREADGDRTFRTWFAGQKVNGSTSSNALPKEVVMTLYGRRGSVISRLTLTNAWPSQWHGATWSLPLGASNILTESVTLVADSATFD